MRSRHGYKSGRTRSNTSGLFVFGLFVLLGIFLTTRLRAGNQTPQQKLIRKLLSQAGYGSNMAYYWSLVSKYETGNFTSLLFTSANNLFGMGVPTKRPSTRDGVFKTTDAGNVRNFSAYASPTESVNDLILYLKYFNYPTEVNSISDLTALMKKNGYFEQDLATYTAGVKRQQ